MRNSLKTCMALSFVPALYFFFSAATVETIASGTSRTGFSVPSSADLAPARFPYASRAERGSEDFLASIRAGLPISSELQAQIPRRVHSADGTPGDVTNFLLIGSQHDVKKALDSTGWNTVASTKLGVIWRDVFESLYVKAYRGIPMTKLYLFGRAQDYGYVHSRGLLSVRNRHHFRIWQAPFQVNGQTLWVGAGTHDVALHHEDGFLHFTHRIDPDVDAERQYIANTLVDGGRAEIVGYLTPPDPMIYGRTSTGQDFYTDGRTVVLQITNTKSRRRNP